MTKTIPFTALQIETFNNELPIEYMHDIHSLWNKNYPSVIHFSMKEMLKYFQSLKDKKQTLVWDEHKLVAYYADFSREDSRDFVMLVDKEYQRMGYGTQLLNRAKLNNDALEGWVITNEDLTLKSGMPYKSPVAFYEKNGFVVDTNNIWKTNKMTTARMKYMP